MEVEAIGAVVDLCHPEAEELCELSINAEVSFVAEALGSLSGKSDECRVVVAVGPAQLDCHLIGHVFSFCRSLKVGSRLAG